MDALIVMCNFISGSDTQGCFVILVGEFNITAHLKRKGSCTSEVLAINSLMSNYRGICGYDIEGNGSIGTLAVPGELSRNVSVVDPCDTEETTTVSSKCTIISYYTYVH